MIKYTSVEEQLKSLSEFVASVFDIAYQNRNNNIWFFEGVEQSKEQIANLSKKEFCKHYYSYIKSDKFLVDKEEATNKELMTEFFDYDIRGYSRCYRQPIVQKIMKEYLKTL